jgi:hypothetical protein
MIYANFALRICSLKHVGDYMVGFKVISQVWSLLANGHGRYAPFNLFRSENPQSKIFLQKLSWNQFVLWYSFLVKICPVSLP